MANVEIIARETVKSLDELRRMPIGEPFAGLINGLTSVFLLKIEEHKGDNYSFLTLPMYQMHQVDILSRDIEFFDLDMLGTIRPLFPQEKTRITTYLKDSIDYNHLQDKVFKSLGAYQERIKMGPNFRSDDLADAALDALAEQRGKLPGHFNN